MRRAISDVQKGARRQAILDVAWRLFQESPYDAVNIIDVARGAGLAKGTVYLYFPSKEALFLDLLAGQWEHWFDRVDAQLAEGEQGFTVEQVAEILTGTLLEHPGLTRLFAILHVVLEHNISTDEALAFKQMLKQRIAHTGELLEQRLAHLGLSEGARLLLRAYALVIGIQHMANPAPVVRELLGQQPDLALFNVSFANEFRESFVALCYGMLRSNSKEQI